MRKSIQEIAVETSTLDDVNVFWSIIHEQLEVRGATSALFGVLASQRELEFRKLSSALIWKSSHKKEFFDAFDDDAVVDNDHTAQHCLMNNQVLFWHDPSDWQSATPAQKKRAEIERDLGLAIGITVPSSFYFPSQVGGVGIAMPDIPLSEFPRFWASEGQEVLTICGILDAGMRAQHLSQLVNLSKREVECLTWLAVGRRPQQIADRLGLSDKTIEKHFASARRKLRATTRDHAVAKALMLGLINP